MAAPPARHEGYAKSINARRGIEKVFGWIEPRAAPKEEKFGSIRQFKLRWRDRSTAAK